MTIINAVRQGQIPEAAQLVAKDEGVPLEDLLESINVGHVVIPRNRIRQFSPRGVGKGLRTKVNANFGTSEAASSAAEELIKLQIACEAGADAVMDLSTAGNLDAFLKQVIAQSPVMVGTVPLYGLFGQSTVPVQADDFLSALEKHAIAGVDFLTLHCGITRRSLSFLEKSPRVLGVVSRGGALLRRWMAETGLENPLYSHFETVLDICAAHDVTLSLGDGFRPGAGHDASDRAQLAELMVLGELVEHAKSRGVQVMVEGPGHVPLNQIQANVQMMKRICGGVPFYVLGPLVTDSVPGYDHIAAAIGGAIASSHGADFLCYVTPAEHLCLPSATDVRDGVMATRIAARAGDVAKGHPSTIARDLAMSEARRDLDWETMYSLALDPALARSRRQAHGYENQNGCSMCGSLCAVNNDRIACQLSAAQAIHG